VWLLQELFSITEGTFTVRITKDDSGFRVLFDLTPTVVRYDSDVPIEMPDYATDRRTTFDEQTYRDRTKVSQGNAAETVPSLLARLDAEFPTDRDHDAYSTGGITLRFSRVGSTVSVGVDREADTVRPVRTLATAESVA
jgi:hypothetical protein